MHDYPLLPDELEFLVKRPEGRSYYFELNGQTLLWYHESISGLEPIPVHPSEDRWEEFWRRMDALGIWHWAGRTHRAAPPVSIPAPPSEPPTDEVRSWRLKLTGRGRVLCYSSAAGASSIPIGATAEEFAELVEAIHVLVGN